MPADGRIPLWLDGAEHSSAAFVEQLPGFEVTLVLRNRRGFDIRCEVLCE